MSNPTSAVERSRIGLLFGDFTAASGGTRVLFQEGRQGSRDTCAFPARCCQRFVPKSKALVDLELGPFVRTAAAWLQSAFLCSRVSAWGSKNLALSCIVVILWLQRRTTLPWAQAGYSRRSHGRHSGQAVSLAESLKTANIYDSWRASSGPRFKDNQSWPTKTKRFS
jgi:hypothetical protein